MHPAVDVPSAKRLSDEPACSKANQKTAEERNRTRIAAERLRSSADHPRPSSSQEKMATETSTRATPSASEINSAANGMAPVAAGAPRITRPASAPPAARATRRFCRRSAAGLSGIAGYRPATPRYFPPKVYWIKPAIMQIG